MWHPQLTPNNFVMVLINAGREAAMFAPMMFDPTQLPDDVATLKAMLIAAAKRAHDAESVRATSTVRSKI